MKIEVYYFKLSFSSRGTVSLFLRRMFSFRTSKKLKNGCLLAFPGSALAMVDNVQNDFDNL